MAVEIFPLTSVTVNVTVFAPISLHVKEVESKAKLAIPQLSVDPSSIWAAVIVSFPYASK